MATIDADKLRDYMRDYFGTAMMGGLPAAILDLADVDSMSGDELCKTAEDNGIDLARLRHRVMALIPGPSSAQCRLECLSQELGP